MAAKGNILTQSHRVTEKVRLGDVCSIVYGERIRKKDSVGGAYPVYGGGGETFRWSTFNRENKCVVSRFAMSKECVRFVSGKFFLNDSGLTVETKDDRSLSQWYLDWFLFGNQDKIYSLGQGAAQKNLEISRFINLEIPLPSLPKQKRIAAVLDKICELKKNAEAQIENLDLLVKSRFVEMFGDEVGGQELVVSNVVRLEEYATISGGYAFKSDAFKKGGVPVIRISNIVDDSVTPDYEVGFDLDFWDKNERFRAITGDILMAMSGATTGKCGIVRESEKLLVNQRVAIIRAKENKGSAFFIKIALLSQKVQEQIKNMSAGCAQPNISGKQIENLFVPKASLALQEEFAAFVEKVEKLKDVAKKSVEEMDTLYRAKLQEYFG